MITIDYNTCLLKVPIFKDLDEEELIAISSLIQPLQLQKAETLFQMGDMTNHLYIVHKGSLKESGLAENGKSRILNILNEGNFIGEHALFKPDEASSNVEAAEPSHICMIDGPSFTDLLDSSPQLARKVIQALISKLKDAEAKNTHTTTLSARERIMQALHESANGSNQITLDMSKTDFASSLGMAKETLSRQLRSLENDQIIRLKSNKIIEIL